MKKVLVIGAGKSSSSLVRYLLDKAEGEGFSVTVTDQDSRLAEQKAGDHAAVTPLALDASNPEARREMIREHDLVISMLPARMHLEVAKDCIELKKDAITPSYVSEGMKKLDRKAQEAGVLILNEIGVDPGIDHMSAMKVLDDIREKGGEMQGFESFTGGLVAPESDNNPWGYKFTWNPRNVVLAGQGGSVKFKQEGRYKYIPPHRVFQRVEPIEIEGYGRFEGYPNRDSLKYRHVYGLDDIPTIYRGTLRRPGFCRAWDVFVQLGATDDSYVIEDSGNMTFRQFINSFLGYNPHDSVELKLMHYLGISQDNDIMEKLEWLGVFGNEKIGIPEATPAQVLQHILEKKWGMEEEDKDMIVMWHRFRYHLNNKLHEVHSSMVSKGEDHTYTAMANTVGYPVAIAARMILNGTITQKGVRLPIEKAIYEPVLQELGTYGIEFREKEVEPGDY